MLSNGNLIGRYRQATTEWNGGVFEPRTHHAAIRDNRLPDTLHVDTVTPCVDTLIGYYNGKSVSIAAQDATMQNMFMSADGTRVYAVGTTNDRIYQYTLSTAFDISTATFVNFFAFGTTVVDPTGLSISPDGTKLFVLGSSADTIYSYTFSTAWNVTTLVYDNVSFSVATQEATPLGLYVKPDGLKFWVVGSTNDTVYEYALGTAWTLSTASYSSLSYSVTAQDATPCSISWSDDGLRFYVFGRTSTGIYGYSTTVAFSLSGTITYVFASEAAAWMIPVDTVTTTGGFYLAPGTRNGYLVNNTSDKIYQIDTGTVDRIAIHLNNAGATQSVVLSSWATSRGLYFTPDGRSFFTADSTSGTMRKYTCSAPWTITSATLSTTYAQLLTYNTTGLTLPGGARFFFSSDGTKYITGDFFTGNVNVFQLDKAWDPSSATYPTVYSSIMPTSIEAISFSWDGLHMYYCSTTTLYHRSMTKAWDLSTLSVAETYSNTAFMNGSFQGIFPSQDGRYLFTIRSSLSRIFKWKMNTAYGFTGMTFHSQSYIANLAPATRGGLYVSHDGVNIFVSDETNDTLYRFDNLR